MKTTAYDNYVRALDRGRLGDSSGALANITRAIKANPKFALAHFERGTIQHHRGKFRAAIEAYSVAITLNPSTAVFYAKRAKARRNMGEFSGSFADFTRVLELDQDILSAHVRGWKCPAKELVRSTTNASSREASISMTSADLTMAIKLSRKWLNAQYAEAYFGRALARVGLMAGSSHVRTV